jgi:hypothetical protein
MSSSFAFMALLSSSLLNGDAHAVNIGEPLEDVTCRPKNSINSGLKNKNQCE